MKYIRERGLKTPVIVVSGYLKRDVVRQVAELGVTAVLSKPVQLKRLREEIQKILG